MKMKLKGEQQMMDITVAPRNNRAWRALYGFDKEEIAALHSLYLVNLSIKELLMTLHFLRVYPSEDAGSTCFGVCRNTWRHTVRRGLIELRRSLPQVKIEFFPFLFKYTNFKIIA